MIILLGILEQGLIYAVIALGVYITYKILDFPDLSVDGTFPMGAALTATLIVAGVNPVLTLFLSFLAGALAGCVTGFIHVKLKVRDLLAGIIVMTAMYSINIRLAGGTSNLPIFSQETLFRNSGLDAVVPDGLSAYTTAVILLVIVAICKILLDLYLKTRSGYLLQAAGDNDVLVTSLAKDKGMVKILGLAIANGFVALAGCIYCQQREVFEVSMGTGTIVKGLASVIIGTQLFSRIGASAKDQKKGALAALLGRLTAVKATTAVIIGSILYQACVSFAISCGLKASDLNLITAALLLLILVFSNYLNSGKKVKGHA